MSALPQETNSDIILVHAGQEKDRQRCKVRLFPDLRDELLPSDRRHHDIGDDQIRSEFESFDQALGAIPGGDDLIVLGEPATEELDDLRLVINEQEECALILIGDLAGVHGPQSALSIRIARGQRLRIGAVLSARRAIGFAE